VLLSFRGAFFKIKLHTNGGIMKQLAYTALLLLSMNLTAGSFYLGLSEPKHFDFIDQTALPADFGKGEFTFEVWVKPDAGFKVGTTSRGSFDQLTHWSDADPEPYSSPGWWLPGNWLLDGHTRPDGFFPDNTREGTFSLQFYGGGRVRWMFSDGSVDTPKNGQVWAVQAYPATTVPSLLDGKWHHILATRRWVGTDKAQLELWVDGQKIAQQLLNQRVNMRQFWDKLAHPDDPAALGGWAWGSEVMTAWGMFFTQYEDYKGQIDEIRFWSIARTEQDIKQNWDRAVPADSKGLVGLYPFNEGKGSVSLDPLDKNKSRPLIIHKAESNQWRSESAPSRAFIHQGNTQF
jgi:hypothetical protein